jgi:hypothetical protein
MSSIVSLSGLPIIPDAPRYFRMVSISNQGTSEVVLLDIRALPEMEDKLRLHDDLKVVENSSLGGTGKGTAEGPVGVSLAPGAEYQVAIVSVKATSCVDRLSRLATFLSRYFCEASAWASSKMRISNGCMILVPTVNETE